MTYTANCTIKVWHEFCGRCEWKENKTCLLFDQKLKEEKWGMFDDGPTILRCTACVSFCNNMPGEEDGEE